MVVGDAHVFPGFLTPVLTKLSFQNHRLLFPHASADVRGENTLDRKFASTSMIYNLTFIDCWKCMTMRLSIIPDDKFKLHENGWKLFKRVENTAGKGEIALFAISPFATEFSKHLYCRHVKTWACLGKGYTMPTFHIPGNPPLKTLWEM